LRHSLRTDQSTPGHTTASILGDPLYVESRLWDLVKQFSGFVFGREGVRLTVGYTGRVQNRIKFMSRVQHTILNLGILVIMLHL
jgi:hypothetical protein